MKTANSGFGGHHLARCHRAVTLVVILGLVSLAFGFLGGCEETADDVLLLEIRAPALVSSLSIQVKQYRGNGEHRIYPAYEGVVSGSQEGYVYRRGDGTPIRVNIQFPGPGRYAVHLVADPLDSPTDLLVATVCEQVDGALVREVVLGRLPQHLDVDGDTFPDDATAFCAQVAEEDIPCETSCDVSQYLAMEDCNPPETLEVPPGCGEVPQAEMWNPFATDQCGDCHDQDCFGGDPACADEDGDGYGAGVDCDDDDAAINPGAEEICGNGIDENCTVELRECRDGDLPCDVDGDGFLAIHPEYEGCGNDCNHDDPAINPRALEGCGTDSSDPDACPGCPPAFPAGVDENCNGQADEGCFSDDLDNDGVDASSDCDDCNAGAGSALELCGNGLDDDCVDGDQPCASVDADHDGVSAAPEGSDCDDGDARVYPGAPDLCGDGVPQNCAADVDCSAITDADGDGFALDDGDCNDGNDGINPWASEICDGAGVDEDCDGLINELEAEQAVNQGCIFNGASGSFETIRYGTDVDHCGGCRNRCCSGACDCRGTACVGGVCQCAGGEACGGSPTSYCCEEGCRDLTTDPENCGGCGFRCGTNEGCRPSMEGCALGECFCEHNGMSQAPCTDGSVCCEGAGCADLTTDIHNCGACGNDCEAEVGVGPRGNICADRGAGPACYCGDSATPCTGSTWCTEVTHPGASCGCRDLLNDRNNCGACGRVCAPSEICFEGECLCEGADRGCSSNETCCPGSGCFELERDEQNCGGCGIRCAWGESCVDGGCVCGSSGTCDASTQDCCDGTCTNVLSDDANCGAVGTGAGCGSTCRDTTSCVSGSCECDNGWVDCGGECNCNVGGGWRCCGSSCVEGECCGDGDCSGASNPHCSPDHNCYCSYEGGECSDWSVCSSLFGTCVGF